MTADNKQVLFCGGEKDSGHAGSWCYQLRGNAWIKHSQWQDSSYKRSNRMQVTMPDGVYIFSMRNNKTTSDFLPRGSTNWQAGPTVPMGPMNYGCVVKISDEEFLIIGGWYPYLAERYVAEGRSKASPRHHACASRFFPTVLKRER